MIWQTQSRSAESGSKSLGISNIANGRRRGIRRSFTPVYRPENAWISVFAATLSLRPCANEEKALVSPAFQTLKISDSENFRLNL